MKRNILTRCFSIKMPDAYSLAYSLSIPQFSNYFLTVMRANIKYMMGSWGVILMHSNILKFTKEMLLIITESQFYKHAKRMW